MQKEDLIKQISALHLPLEVEEVIRKKIEENEITSQLLDEIADILDFQSTLEENELLSLDEEANIYRDLAIRLEKIDAEENDELCKIYDEAKKKLIDLKKEVEDDVQKAEAKEDLDQATQSQNQAAAN